MGRKSALEETRDPKLDPIVLMYLLNKQKTQQIKGIKYSDDFGPMIENISANPNVKFETLVELRNEAARSSNTSHFYAGILKNPSFDIWVFADAKAFFTALGDNVFDFIFHHCDLNIMNIAFNLGFIKRFSQLNWYTLIYNKKINVGFNRYSQEEFAQFLSNVLYQESAYSRKHHIDDLAKLAVNENWVHYPYFQKKVLNIVREIINEIEVEIDQKIA